MPTVADLARDALAYRDPVSLAVRAGIVPYPYQQAVLRSRADQVILNWARQAGKSTITSILPVHLSLFFPGSLTLLLAPGDRQAGLLLDKVYDIVAAIGEYAAQTEQENTRYLRFANTSEIWALPGKEGTIRGFSGVDLIVIDEASRVPDSLYYAVRPMLAASSGRTILLSTPFGKRGFFHRVWTDGGTSWERHERPYQQVPHLVDSALIAEDRTELPPEWFAQEYECRFVDTTGQLFPYELVESLFQSDREPFFESEEPAWSRALIAATDDSF